MNLNHLRTHGMVSWDQYQEAVAQRQRPDQTLIREVAHSLLHRQEVPQAQAQKLAAINAGYQATTQGFMSATSVRRRLRVLKLMEALEGMEDIQLNPEKFAEYSFEQLLDLMKFVSGDMNKIFDQMADELKKGSSFGTAVEAVANNQYVFVNANGGGTPYDDRLPTDPREEANLMSRVNEMLSRLRSGEQPIVVPNLAESGSVAGNPQP